MILLRCHVSAGTSVSSSQALCFYKWFPGIGHEIGCTQAEQGSRQEATWDEFITVVSVPHLFLTDLRFLQWCHANNMTAKNVLSTYYNCFHLILTVNFGLCQASNIPPILEMRILRLKLA